MNRHSRTLLTVFIVAILLIPIWLSRRSVPGAIAPSLTDSAPGRLSQGAPVKPAPGGTLLASARSEPRSFNRVATPSFPTEMFTLLTQAKLVRINRATQELEPWLAEKWVASADNLSYTLTLRDQVKWSDGTAFTSADVLFSFEAAYQKDSVLASSLQIGGKPLKVAAPDTRTVVVTYPETLAPGIRLLDNLVILPKHKLEAALRDGKFSAAWSAATPPSELVGLGPFMLSRYEPGQRLIYDRNPYYWRKDAAGQPLPYLDRIVIEIVPEQDAEIVRLRTGEIDVVQQPLRASDIAAFRVLQQQNKVRLEDLGVATEADHFFFNLRPAKWEKDARSAWLPRKEFRQAISHAVDREAFANTVYLGEAVPVHGPITPGNQRWFWPDTPRYQPSLDKARALLDTVGLKNRDADEWLEDERGNEARFTLQTFAGNSTLERSAAVIKEDLKQIGVAVDVVTLEPNTVMQHMVAGDFDALLVSFQMSDLDPALNQDFWLSSGASHVWNPEQKTPATDWEREIDALIHRQAVTMDEEERQKLFRGVQRIFAENLPIIYFAAPRVYIAVTPRVVTMTPSLLRPQVLWNPEIVSVAAGSGKPVS